jgi:aspartate racemase
MRTVGLLGTRATMDEDFISRPLQEKFGLQVLLPDDADRTVVDEVIFGELCLGIIRPESRKRFVGIIEGLARRGAEGVILGCTEIELLVRPEDSAVELFPTTRIHAMAAVDFALGEGAGSDS